MSELTYQEEIEKRIRDLEIKNLESEKKIKKLEASINDLSRSPISDGLNGYKNNRYR